MPSFTGSEYVDVEVDVDVNDFLSECSSDEIEEVIEYLIDNNFISKDREAILQNLSIGEEQLHKNLDKIKDNYYILSDEEEYTIKRIADKL
jgi:hypothetical protein